MEYLMTYGWAILVVIIVGIVLWQSGVFGTGSGGVSGFDKVRVRDYSFSSATDNLTVKFENAAGQTMKNVWVVVANDGTTFYNMSIGSTNTSNWAPGKEYALTSTNTTVCTAVGGGYSLDIQINYTSEANVPHTEAGTIRGKCE